MFTLEQGTRLIKLARKAIETKVMGIDLNFDREKQEFLEQLGVFVTLNTWPQKALCGCIGFPYPIKPLAEAVVEAARSAAFSDPRFKPLEKRELLNITIEISVLTQPQQLTSSRQELLRAIETGKDGLIIQFSGFSGLLLPQVAPEQGWNALELLRGTCAKAGLPAETWLNPACKVFKFQAQIFSEEKPGEKIIEKK